MFMPSNSFEDDSHLWVVDYGMRSSTQRILSNDIIKDSDGEDNLHDDNYDQDQDVNFLRRRTNQRTRPRQIAIH